MNIAISCAFINGGGGGRGLVAAKMHSRFLLSIYPTARKHAELVIADFVSSRCIRVDPFQALLKAFAVHSPATLFYVRSLSLTLAAITTTWSERDGSSEPRRLGIHGIEGVGLTLGHGC